MKKILLVKSYFYKKFHKRKEWIFLKLIKNDIHLFFIIASWGCFRIGNGKIKVLCINHFFDGEIDALKAKIGENLSIKVLKPEPSFSRGYAWYSDDIQKAEIEIDQWPESVNKKYKKYNTYLFFILRAVYRFDVLITPSDSFFWLREFLDIANQNGVTTIVADKEGMISPGNYVTGPDRIKALYPPIAKYFFVWSERQRNFWMRAGVSPENIFVIGSLRTDLLFNKSLKNRDSIIYFDFDFDAYLTDLDWSNVNWDKDRDWVVLRREYHDAIFQLANKYPQYKFKIKTHPQQVITDLNEKFRNLRNVEVINGSAKRLPEYFGKAKLVIGFQTTAILEAALCGLPVIYGAWGKLFQEVQGMLLPWHKGNLGIAYKKSKLCLIDAAIEIIEHPPVKYTYKGCVDDMNEYFYMANGETATRFVNKMMELLMRN